MGASIARVDRGGMGHDVLLRAALVMPLLYVILRSVHVFASSASQAGEAFSYYLVNGLLDGVPIAVWGLALVLLVLGTEKMLAWAVVCVGGFAVSAYGLLGFLEVGRRLNMVLAFGLYVALFGLWKVLQKRRTDEPSDPEPEA